MGNRTCWRVGALFMGISLLAWGLMADTVVSAIASGNWSDTSIWSPAVVPNNSGGTTYDVNIPYACSPVSCPALPNVAVDISPTVNSLSMTSAGEGGGGPTLEVLNGSTLTAGTITEGPATASALLITVDNGGTLNAGAVGFGARTGLDVAGTATIGSLSGVQGELGVGGLVNVGSISGGANTIDVGGTLNIAAQTLSSGIMRVGGTVTVGTGNLLPLSSQNTLVNNGQIAVNLNLLVGFTTNPLCSTGGFCIGGNGTYDEVIDSATGFGTLISDDAISLGGTLGITLANSYVPPVGQSFLIMYGTGPLSGTFANIEGQTFDNGTEMWDVSYGSNGVVLTAAPASVVPEPSLLVLTGFGLAGIVAWTRSRRRQAA